MSNILDYVGDVMTDHGFAVRTFPGETVSLGIYGASAEGRPDVMVTGEDEEPSEDGVIAPATVTVMAMDGWAIDWNATFRSAPIELIVQVITAAVTAADERRVVMA